MRSWIGVNWVNAVCSTYPSLTSSKEKKYQSWAAGKLRFTACGFPPLSTTDPIRVELRLGTVPSPAIILVSKNSRSSQSKPNPFEWHTVRRSAIIATLKLKTCLEWGWRHQSGSLAELRMPVQLVARTISGILSIPTATPRLFQSFCQLSKSHQ